MRQLQIFHKCFVPRMAAMTASGTSQLSIVVRCTAAFGAIRTLRRNRRMTDSDPNPTCSVSSWSVTPAPLIARYKLAGRGDLAPVRVRAGREREQLLVIGLGCCLIAELLGGLRCAQEAPEAVRLLRLGCF